MLRPWTFDVRLGNPHQLCHMNAGVLSLLHAAQSMRMVEIAGIEALCRQCAGSGQVLMLSRQTQVRSVMPRWNFGPTQSDVSEFLLSLLSLCSEALFQWEARQIRQDNMVVMDLGGPVLFLEVAGLDFWTPTQAFAAWSQAESRLFLGPNGSLKLKPDEIQSVPEFLPKQVRVLAYLWGGPLTLGFRGDVRERVPHREVRFEFGANY